MAEYVIMPGAHYQDACDAIREKTGKTDLIKSGDMASEIEGLSDSAKNLSKALIERTITKIDNLDGITSIKTYAFEGCHHLINLVIPDSVTSIGDHASYLCYKLIEICNKSNLDITTGGSISDIGYYAKRIITDESDSCLTTIDDYTFYNDGTESYFMGYEGDDDELVLPNFNENQYGIYTYAFGDKSSLRSVVIPEGVTSIGDSAFDRCQNLEELVIPDSVTSIDGKIFASCYNLSSLTIPFIGRSLTTSEDTHRYPFATLFSWDSANEALYEVEQAFGSNVMVRTLLPLCLESVTVTGGDVVDYAFQNCTSLVNITLPDSATMIGSHAFENCTNLASITIPSNVKSIGGYAFYCCRGLEDSIMTIPANVETIGYAAFGSTSIREFTFCGTPTSISPYAFALSPSSDIVINVPWSEGEVANAPWGATNATINYNYVEE